MRGSMPCVMAFPEFSGGRVDALPPPLSLRLVVSLVRVDVVMIVDMFAFFLLCPPSEDLALHLPQESAKNRFLFAHWASSLSFSPGR